MKLIKKGIDANVFDKAFWLLTIYFCFQTIRVQDVISPVGALRLPLIMMVCLFFYWYKYCDRSVLKEDVIRYQIAFLILCTVSIIWVVNHGAAKKSIEIMFMFFIGGVLPAAGILLGFKRISMFFFVWAVSNGILSIQGILEGGTGPGGYVEDENDLALALNMGMPYAFMLSKAKTLSSLKRYILLALGVVMCFGVVATSSRGGFLGLIAVVGMFWWWSEKRIRNLLIVGTLAIVGALGAYKLGFISEEWVADMQTIEDTEDETRNERIHSWKLGWMMFETSPIWGVGIENYAWNVAEMEKDLPYDPDYKSLAGRQSHSVPFTLIPELGILGLFIFIMILYHMNKGCTAVHKASKKYPDNDELHDLALMAKAVRVAIVTFLITGMFISVLYYPHFWYLIGFLVATEREARALEGKLDEENAESTEIRGAQTFGPMLKRI